MFSKQFLGNSTWQMMVSIVAVHALALFVKDTSFALPALIFVGVVAFTLAWRDLSWGLILAFIELFIGGHGHLIHADVFGFSLSIRMVIFAAVMLAWLIQILKGDVRMRYVAFRDAPWIMLAVAVLLGTLIGFAQNDTREAFDDMNGFLTIAYLLPLISIEWTVAKKRHLLQALFASALWLTVFTLVLSFLFTHLDGKALHPIYQFVRDQRLAEVTLQTVSNDDGVVVNERAAVLFGDDGYYYRVFMQSHFYVAIMLLLTSSGLLVLWRDQRLPEWVAGVFAALVAVIIASMSRSFFLGLLVAGLWIFALSFTVGKKPVWNVFKRVVLTIALCTVGAGVFWATVAFPFPPQPSISDAAFYQTSADTDRDVALSSRWELLGPLMSRIWQNPIAGAGFGANVTYITDDPRIRSMNPTGEYTTYRFEWGYQDLWLKMGVFGLLAFLWYYVAVFQAMHVTMRRHGQKWIMIGLSGGLILLAVAHVFSPYLNHPIGLAYMLFVLPFIDFSFGKKEEPASEGLTTLEFAQPIQMAGAVRFEEEG